MDFTAGVTHEESWCVAHCLEVGVTSQGDAVGRALANLKEGEFYFDDEVSPEELGPLMIATLRLSA